jgi:hypothetical protein
MLQAAGEALEKRENELEPDKKIDGEKRSALRAKKPRIWARRTVMVCLQWPDRRG